MFRIYPEHFAFCAIRKMEQKLNIADALQCVDVSEFCTVKHVDDCSNWHLPRDEVPLAILSRLIGLGVLGKAERLLGHCQKNLIC